MMSPSYLGCGRVLLPQQNAFGVQKLSQIYIAHKYTANNTQHKIHSTIYTAQHTSHLFSPHARFSTQDHLQGGRRYIDAFGGLKCIEVLPSVNPLIVGGGRAVG